MIWYHFNIWCHRFPRLYLIVVLYSLELSSENRLSFGWRDSGIGMYSHHVNSISNRKHASKRNNSHYRVSPFIRTPCLIEGLFLITSGGVLDRDRLDSRREVSLRHTESISCKDSGQHLR